MNPETMWNISVLRSALVQLGNAEIQAERIMAMHSNRISQRQIAKALGISPTSVCRIIAAAKALSVRAAASREKNVGPS